MKHVLFNLTMTQPNRINGVSQYAFSLLREMAARGDFEYVLVTSWDVEKIPSYIRDLDIQIIKVPHIASLKLAYIFHAVTIFVISWIKKSAVVFTPNPFGPPFSHGKRVVVIHDLYPLIYPELYRGHDVATWRLLVKIASSQSADVICVSHATKKDFVDNYGLESRLTVIHEAPAVGPEPVPGASQAERERYSLTVANITRTKNIGLLFEALAILGERGLEPTFYWVGRDDSGDFAAAQERFPNVRNLKSVGSVSADRLAALYRDAEFYVTTSLIEGFCIPVLEAQQAGTPVLCTDIPTLREVAGEGALYFSADDPQRLADQIETMWTDPEARQKLSTRALENARQFSWERAAMETEAIFSRLAQAS